MPSFRRTLNENVYVYPVNNVMTALTDTTYPGASSYLPMSEFEFGCFLIHFGTLNSDINFQVWQAKTAAGGDAKVLTGAAITAATNEMDNKWLTIEFAQSALDVGDDFGYVAIVVDTTGGSDDWADIIFLGLGARRTPVTQSANYVDSVVIT